MALLALLFVVAAGTAGFLIIGGRGTTLIDALYMTVITLTTVGFGEMVDLSTHPEGRLFTIFLLLGGMGIVAYTAMLLAAFVLEGQLGHIFARRRNQRRITRMDEHYIVCGNSPSAWYLAEELLKTGRQLVLVTSDYDSLEESRERLGDLPAVVGDPGEDEVLREAGVEKAAGVVFCMENDKDTLLGVITARRMAPGVRIVAGTEQPGIGAKLRTAGADAVVSTSRIGGLRMASELVRPTVVTFLDQMLRDREGSLRVEELQVPERTAEERTRVGELRIEEVPRAVLLALRRPGEEGFEFKPPPDTPLMPGMRLVVMTDREGRERLSRALERI